MNFVEPLQVLLNPRVEEIATIGDAKVSEMNGTQVNQEGETDVTLLMYWLILDFLLYGVV